MTPKTIASLFLALFVATQISAQSVPDSTFQAAIITLKDGSQQSGYLQADDVKRWSQQISFKPTLTQRETTTYFPDQLDGFSLLGSQQRFATQPVALIEESSAAELSKKTVDRFSRLLVDGAYDLYKVELLRGEYNSDVTGSADHLYLLVSEQETLQIDLLRTKGSGSQQRVSERYKSVLDYAFRDCDKVSAKSTSFNDKSMAKLVVSYSECVQEESRLYMDLKSNAFVTENRITAHYGETRDENFNDYAELNFGYQATIFRSSGRRRLGFTIGAEVSLQNYLWIIDQTRYDQIFLQVPLFLDFKLWSNERQRITLQPGIVWHQLLQSNPEVVRGGISVASYALLTANLVYDYDRIRLILGYGGQGDVLIGIDNAWTVGVGYRFK
ncbi:MAG: hypothetical protein AAGI23_08590 [Bacteroidota bacterium]